MTYRKLINLLPQEQAPEYLFRNILDKVKRIELRRKRFVALGYLMSTVFAIVLFYPVINNLLRVVYHSGFGQYLSLIITDGSYSLMYWRELSLSIMSSLPIEWISAVLATTLLLVFSIRGMIKYSSYLSFHSFSRYQKYHA